MINHVVSYFAKPDGYFDRGTEAFLQYGPYMEFGDWVASFIGIKDGVEESKILPLSDFDERE